MANQANISFQINFVWDGTSTVLDCHLSTCPVFYTGTLSYGLIPSSILNNVKGILLGPLGPVTGSGTVAVTAATIASGVAKFTFSAPGVAGTVDSVGGTFLF